MADTHETIADIIAEMRGMGNYQRYSGDHARVLANRIDAAHKRERAKIEADALTVGGIVEAERKRERGDCAKLRERRLLMSCARWILCHDIYGHTAKELLAECKEVLNDDGQFLFKEDEQ